MVRLHSKVENMTVNSVQFTTLFVICIRFEERSSAWFITVRLHEVFGFIRTLLIIMEWQGTTCIACQSFRSDWAVPTGGVLDPVKEAGFPNILKLNQYCRNKCNINLPSFSLSPSEDIQNKENNDDEIDDEAN